MELKRMLNGTYDWSSKVLSILTSTLTSILTSIFTSHCYMLFFSLSLNIVYFSIFHIFKYFLSSIFLLFFEATSQWAMKLLV